MSLRTDLGIDAATVHARLDTVLDSDDAIVILVDRNATTTYVQGLGLSGCQADHLASDLARLIGRAVPRATTAPRPGTDSRGRSVAVRRTTSTLSAGGLPADVSVRPS